MGRAVTMRTSNPSPRGAGLAHLVAAFLLVSPTPEPQYVPMVVLLFLGALVERDRANGRTRSAAAGGAGPAPAAA